MIRMAPNNHTNGKVCVDTYPTNVHSHYTSPPIKFQSRNQKSCDEALIFFDWDDTLMASTSISKLGLCPKFSNQRPAIPAHVGQELKRLELAVVSVLEKALLYGRVVIITAAEAGWVELSATLYMPGVLPYLNTYVKVISARSTFEGLYPDCPLRWKIEAFKEVVDPLWYLAEQRKEDMPKHIISVGDGPTEREALINTKLRSKSICHGKSLKFIGHPKISELCMELELIYANLEHFCTHEGDLDLQITLQMLQNRV